ncbi:NAD(+) diphosphatase [Alisedimentitalea sp. MJ-SS2]|uniref:NAD(+) diphosphatase n=1 Tax=Aliisedimentitalea sp. MJ-SS2 TaxID=3049795 RepID=UPI0029159989|nr:NAD(+) diphosphatase [Alisedimentitalea sp. MJ-SS2]MDU8928098.1 NAD(+) diphosphatase [Alisedimentitalea sp. MJ-SS2]
MKIAETVTFGGSGLNRAAHLRGDATALAEMAAFPTAVSILIWRGKPLFEGEGHDRLARLRMDHALVKSSGIPAIFMGREEDGTPVFAHDISGWQPEDLDREAMGSFFDQSVQVHPLAPEGAVFLELRGRMAAINPRDAELAATAKSMFSWHRSHRFCAKCGSESKMAMAGWQRNCPACGAPHFPRTDPVVIMLITHGNQVLMGRSPGWPDGMYSLLAGFVEPGETIEAAVRREVEEESSIKVGQVDYLASQPWPYPSSLMIGCRGAALSDEIEIDPNEIEDARWFTREEIADSFAGRNPDLKPARAGAIAHFILWNWLADRLD